MFFFSLFLKYLDDLPGVRHIDFVRLIFFTLLRLFIAALLLLIAGKGLTSWLLLAMFIVILLLPICYPGSGVVLDCIVSLSLPPFLISLPH